MSTTWESSIGTGDTVCQRCGQLYFREGGCQNCRETAKAASKLRHPVEERAPRATREWFVATPFGTKGFRSPEDAANGRNSVTEVKPGIYKWIRSVKTWAGYAVLIRTSSSSRDETWVLQTFNAGVYARKSKANAEKVMKEAVAS